ncbi:MAG: hypothetical protein LBT89_02055 [Planctomycetaceae bacterium]|jgi:hypothetical protein|nr:hypothetical protein [Planctomycetaceae bacterium]
MKETRIAKLADRLITELSVSISRRTIDSYYDFTEKWNEQITLNGKMGRGGECFIKTIAPKVGIAPPTIYAVLRICTKYPRQRYETLKNALPDGRILCWSHLKTMLQYCKTQEQIAAAEHLLYENNYTDTQWAAECFRLGGRDWEADIPKSGTEKPKAKNSARQAGTPTIADHTRTIRSVVTYLQHVHNRLETGMMTRAQVVKDFEQLEDAVNSLDTIVDKIADTCELGNFVKSDNLILRKAQYDRYRDVKQAKLAAKAGNNRISFEEGVG